MRGCTRWWRVALCAGPLAAAMAGCSGNVGSGVVDTPGIVILPGQKGSHPAAGGGGGNGEPATSDAGQVVPALDGSPSSAVDARPAADLASASDGAGDRPVVKVDTAAPNGSTDAAPKPPARLDAASPTVYPTLYEAELAHVSGAAIQNRRMGYSGTGYVEFSGQGGGTIEFTVMANPGDTEFAIQYNNSMYEVQAMDLAINSVSVASSASFPPSASWSTWGRSTFHATMQAGKNLIRLKAGNRGGPDVDYLIVTKGAPSVPVDPPPAPPPPSTDAAPTPVDPPPPPPPPPAPKSCDAEAMVFTPRCATCHRTTPPDLFTANVFARLLDKAGSNTGQCAQTRYINSSATDTGFLYERLNGRCGSTMPPDGKLSAAEMDCIKAWAANQGMP